MRIREKERISPIFEEMFSFVDQNLKDQKAGRDSRMIPRHEERELGPYSTQKGGYEKQAASSKIRKIRQRFRIKSIETLDERKDIHACRRRSSRHNHRHEAEKPRFVEPGKVGSVGVQSKSIIWSGSSINK